MMRTVLTCLRLLALLSARRVAERSGIGCTRCAETVNEIVRPRAASTQTTTTVSRPTGCIKRFARTRNLKRYLSPTPGLTLSLKCTGKFTLRAMRHGPAAELTRRSRKKGGGARDDRRTRLSRPLCPAVCKHLRPGFAVVATDLLVL
jgi:hypothetical protein